MSERPPHTSQATMDRGRLRREGIIEAAADLWSKNGHRGTGLAAIAEQVGVTQPTILHHFGSKQGLVAAVVASLLEASEAAWREALAIEGSLIRDVLPHFADLIRSDTRRAHLLTVLTAENLAADDPGHSMFVDHYVAMRDAVAERLRREYGREASAGHGEPDLVAARIVAVVVGLRRRWASDPDTVDLEAALQSLSETLAVSPSSAD